MLYKILGILYKRVLIINLLLKKKKKNQMHDDIALYIL